MKREWYLGLALCVFCHNTNGMAELLWNWTVANHYDRF